MRVMDSGGAVKGYRDERAVKQIQIMPGDNDDKKQLAWRDLGEIGELEDEYNH